MIAPRIAVIGCGSCLRLIDVLKARDAVHQALRYQPDLLDAPPSAAVKLEPFKAFANVMSLDTTKTPAHLFDAVRRRTREVLPTIEPDDFYREFIVPCGDDRTVR